MDIIIEDRYRYEEEEGALVELSYLYCTVLYYYCNATEVLYILDTY